MMKLSETNMCHVQSVVYSYFLSEQDKSLCLEDIEHNKEAEMLSDSLFDVVPCRW